MAQLIIQQSDNIVFRDAERLDDFIFMVNIQISMLVIAIISKRGDIFIGNLSILLGGFQGIVEATSIIRIDELAFFLDFILAEWLDAVEYAIRF